MVLCVYILWCYKLECVHVRMCNEQIKGWRDTPEDLWNPTSKSYTETQNKYC